jgi:hypothetical protein
MYPYVQRLLEDAIHDAAILRPRFEFNRFEVTVERADNVVILEDVLDATEAQTLRLPEFVHALGRRSA